MVFQILTANCGHLGFRTFMSQILIDFFWSLTVSSRIENRSETFCFNFCWGHVIYLPVSMLYDSPVLQRPLRAQRACRYSASCTSVTSVRVLLVHSLRCRTKIKLGRSTHWSLFEMTLNSEKVNSLDLQCFHRVRLIQ